jgi:hypothetical protein
MLRYDLKGRQVNVGLEKLNEFARGQTVELMIDGRII